MSDHQDHQLGEFIDDDDISDHEPHELDLAIPEVPEEDSSIDGLPTYLKTVWDTGKVEKTIHPQTGKKVWKCHFCNGMWSEWNHTKAVGHVTGGGRDIASCKMIPPQWRKVFSAFFNSKLQARAKRAEDLHNFNLSLAEKESNAMLLYNASKDASLSARNPKKHSPSNMELSLTPNSSVVSTISKPSGEVGMKRQKVYHQQNLSNTIPTKKAPPEAERQLSLMINHFITANALPFHLSECPLLNRMLVFARNTTNSYKPPRRTEMSGALLDANYTAYQTSSIASLLMNANIFGLGIYGDGATIGKIPMMNVLAASAGNPNCVLDIVDCSRHMSEGGKKDAYYICQQMLPKMRLLDPDRNLFDWISFDGASNVQKAGSLIEQYFPRCTVTIGVEHTVSLLFGKVMSIRPMKEMCGFAKKVCENMCPFKNYTVSKISFFLPDSSGKFLALSDMRRTQSSGRSVKFITMVRRFCSLNLLSVGWVGRPSSY